MKTFVMLLALAGALTLAVPQDAVAQRAGAYSRVYDPSTVETVSGHVQSVQHAAGHWHHGNSGVHLVLNTRTGRLVVHLGPEWFMRRQHLKFRRDEFVTVTGSRVMLGGEHVLVAARITKGQQTLVLREANGLPVWRGSRYKR